MARCIYDNLKAAVKRRLGIERELSVRFQALCSHYVFEPCFARPGEGHDKGGVEARGKNVRLQHLTPIPSGASLDAIATELLEHLDAATDTRTDQDGRTVAQRFSEERQLLRPLPQRSFEARHVEPVAVSRQALVRVDGARYSVPSHWSGSQATAYVGVTDIVLEWRQERITVAKQPRGTRAVQYRHYLDELAKKPQAVRQVAPELMEEFGAPYVRLWKLLCSRYGELDAARVLAKLIGAIVDHGEQQITQILEEMLATPPRVAARSDAPPATVPVPDALQRYHVESTPASTYNVLMVGRDR